MVYVEKLTEHAQKQDVFRLEEDTTRLTVDVIGKVVLDVRFNMQRGENDCIKALREQVHFLPNETLDPFVMWRPYGIYRRWVNARIMNKYIGKVLDERFASKEVTTTKRQRKRTIIDLALDSYVSNAGDVEKDAAAAAASNEPLVMDAEFRKGAITQIRLVVFLYLLPYTHLMYQQSLPLRRPRHHLLNDLLRLSPPHEASQMPPTHPRRTRSRSRTSLPNSRKHQS